MKNIANNKGNYLYSMYDFYWSSTECIGCCAFNLRPSNGVIDKYGKNARIFVRPFINL